MIATILGSDQVNPHDVISINGASAALMVSGIPFNGPIGAVRMAHHDGEWIAHPTYEEGAESTFQLVVAGRRTDAGEIAVMMVEAGGTEKSWELYEAGAPKMTEDVIAEGLEAAKEWIGKAIDLQQELVAAVVLARGPIAPKAYEPRVDYQPDVFEAVAAQATPNTTEAMFIADKTERNDRLDEILEGLTPRARRHARRARRVRRSRRRGEEGVPLAAEAGRPQAHRHRRRPHRRSRPHRPPSALGRGRAAQHGARLRPVPAGRDPGALGPHARHVAHGADRRHARSRRPQALHAPLQLPAVLHR